MTEIVFNIHLLVHSGVRLIKQNVVVEPCESWFWECNVRNMDGKIFSRRYCDVPHTTEVHAWLVWLFLNQNVVTWSARV